MIFRKFTSECYYNTSGYWCFELSLKLNNFGKMELILDIVP